MNYDYNNDAERIYNACKGLGTREEDIIQVIGKRKLAERHQIRLAYFSKYNKDLLDVLDSELSGDFGELARNLFLGPIQVLAFELYKIFKKTGSAGGDVNDIICCLSPTEITALKSAYLEVLQYEDVKDKTRSLEKDIEKETKGGHRDFLLKFISTHRPEYSAEQIKSAAATGHWEDLIDMQQVERSAAAIHAAGEGKAGKGNETEVTRILCTASVLDIRAIYDHFKDVYNVSLVDFITKAFKNPLRDAYNNVIMSAVDLRLLLVAQLYNSMHGLGTDERTLSRIIAIRSEIDLPTLKVLYQQKIGRSLAEMVKSDTSSDYRSLLMTLLGEK
ncbi:Annexin A13 [Echinococcus granulosus]|uniref:Annexin n=1 Tax=Echinococcus granulosus TaxID=6210 RepID=U6JIM9_ECHGR|nr:Annexin A13 [Echinococcus granulosus]EUB64724.1 Annexin A13 [Echinococcus granulosus]KAH9278702.1 Annexin A13 [Echinococcus granulosus]CDS23893.1 annexin [Echinococcus granulosus]